MTNTIRLFIANIVVRIARRVYLYAESGHPAAYPLARRLYGYTIRLIPALPALHPAREEAVCTIG